MNSILAIVYMFNAVFLPFDERGAEKYFETKKNTTAVEFQLGVEVMDLVTFYGGEKTKQELISSFNFSPYYQQYYCGVDVHYTFNDALKLSAGVYRTCAHPMKAWNKEPSHFDNASLEVYLQVEGKINVF